MTKYVLGFYFKIIDGIFYVFLIKKERPILQAGKYNGIGGKIDDNIDSSPEEAMIREFQEESGMATQSNNWYRFCEFTDDNNFYIYCYFFVDLSSQDTVPMTITDEIIEKFPIGALPFNIVPNIRWLIPMALSFKCGENAYQFNVKKLELI